MLTFLYDFPNWVMGTIISVFFVATTLTAYFLYRRFIRSEFSDAEKSLAMSMLAVVATVNALLLAFSAVSVWESFGAADAAVVEEANGIGQLARDLAVFDSGESRHARDLLRQYARTVIEREWETMQEGEADDEAWRQFDELFRAVAALQPDTPQRVALLPEVWSKVNELLGHRRDRLYVSQSEVPGTLWTVVIAGTVLTLLTTFVLPPTRFDLTMIIALAFSIGLVFYFIIAMDRPFAGEESISPAPFESAIANMERWDRETAR